MLEIRPTCEHCNISLPNDSNQAMICTFECTFCAICVDTLLQNVCPNCGGGFSKRPTRPIHLLKKYPASTTVINKVVVMESFKKLLDRYNNIHARKR